MLTNATIDLTRPGETRDDNGLPTQTATTVFSGKPCLYAPQKAQRFVNQSGEQSFDQPKDSVALPANYGIIQEGDVAVIHCAGTKRTFVVESSQPVQGLTIFHWKLDLKAVSVIQSDEVVPEAFLAQPNGSLIIQPDGSKILVY